MHTKFQAVKVAVLLMLVGVMSLFFFTIGFADAPTVEDSVAAPAAVPTVPPLYTYLSSKKNGTVGGVSFRDEDIVRFNSATGTWELFFDGSDVGVGNNDLDAFELKADGGAPLGFVIIMSFERKFSNLAGLGAVQPWDIVKFTPSIIGNATAGSWSIFLQGNTVGLNNSSENIDAIAFDPSDRLVISTVGTAVVPGLTAKDEDLMVWDGSAWQLYLDGSAIKLTTGNEDVDGAWIEPTGDKNIYLSTKGNFNAVSNGTAVSGSNSDIFGVSPGAATPPITSGFLFAHFSSGVSAIDGIFISFTGAPVSLVAADSVSAATADDVTVAQYEVSSEDLDSADSEIDEFDTSVEEAEALNKRMFIPVAITQ